jgi:hypothetical protein
MARIAFKCSGSLEQDEFYAQTEFCWIVSPCMNDTTAKNVDNEGVSISEVLVVMVPKHPVLLCTPREFK